MRIRAARVLILGLGSLGCYTKSSDTIICSDICEENNLTFSLIECSIYTHYMAETGK